MRSHEDAPTTPWSCRFTTPSASMLLDGLDPQSRSLVEKARRSLSDLEGIGERIRWQGVPWRWAFTYAPSGGRGPAAAYIVPRPDSPSLAAPLSEHTVCSMDVPALPPIVRDGIASGNRVGTALWCEWKPSTEHDLDAVIEVIALERSAGVCPSMVRPHAGSRARPSPDHAAART